MWRPAPQPRPSAAADAWGVRGEPDHGHREADRRCGIGAEVAHPGWLGEAEGGGDDLGGDRDRRQERGARRRAPRPNRSRSPTRPPTSPGRRRGRARSASSEMRAARDRSTSAPMALTSASAAAIRGPMLAGVVAGSSGDRPASPAVSATRYRSVIAPSTSCAGSSVSSWPNSRCRSQYEPISTVSSGSGAVRNDDRDAHVELRGEQREEREHRPRPARARCRR